MDELFTKAVGRKVVSRESAEQLGEITHFVIDTQQRAVSAVVVGKRRDAKLLMWDDITGFGADAVIATSDEVLREPEGDVNKEVARGKLDPLKQRVLSDLGVELGHVDDIQFDTGNGALLTIIVAGQEHHGETLLGAGSYAVVLRAA